MFQKKPTTIDVLILSCFTVLITLQPYFLNGKINIYEVGLYLPGINALLHGQVPYRDFFHLRGPFELYMPAFLMRVFGTNIAVLSAYFYVGTILTLVLCVFLAKELYRTRLILYVMVPVLVGKTFPRVVFTYWGGIRYAFGIFVLYCLMRFVKTNQRLWIFLSGIGAALGLFTSIEIGVCAVAGILATLLFIYVFDQKESKAVLRSFWIFVAGTCSISIPYGFYLLSQGALIPFVDSLYAVVFLKETIINQHIVSEIPGNLFEALRAMVVPTGKNFRHMTPAYLYLALLGYFIYRVKNKKTTRLDAAVFGIGIYGFIMYNSSFRGIWAAQFEMALQPEKILFFFLLEEFYFFLKNKGYAVSLKKWPQAVMDFCRVKNARVYCSAIFLFILLGSSLGYSLQRYNHRFFAFQYVRHIFLGKDTQSLIPLANEETRPINIERAKGMIVPVSQAEELEAVVDFFQKNTASGEAVVTYPELGTYNFLIDRPFLGRFPIATFSWFQEKWHREFMEGFKNSPPKYAILQKEFLPNWKEVYLSREENRAKYNEFLDTLRSAYVLKKETPGSFIYIHKE